MKSTTCGIICLFFVGMLFSCGNGSDKTGFKAPFYDTYENYQEACHAQDFEAAHKILAYLKNKGEKNYAEAREYIFNQEALFLIGENNEESNKRLFFLLQEDASEVDSKTRDARCNTIIDLALKQKNTNLIEQTLNQYSGKIDRNVISNIYTYFYQDGNKADADYLIPLLHKNGCLDMIVEDAIKNNDDKLIRNILSKTGCQDSPEAAKKIALYASSKRYRKLLGSLLTELRSNKQWETILDVGVVLGDMSLVRQGYKNTENKDGAFEKLVSQNNAGNNRAIMQFLQSIVTDGDKAQQIIELCIKNDNGEAVASLTKKFGTKLDRSFMEEVMDYAISKNGAVYTNLVISILTSTPIYGHPLPAGQRMTSNRPESVVSSHNSYVSSVQSFNNECDRVLEAAISQHKGVLARKVVSLYKDVPNEYVVNEHWWQIAKTCVYSKEDKKRAQEELNEAKRRGDI